MVCAVCSAARLSTPAPPEPLSYLYASANQLLESAISRYETQGLEAILTHYNREESVDGQWYISIIDENDLAIGDPDANGYNFGPDILSATKDDKWVSYVESSA